MTVNQIGNYSRNYVGNKLSPYDTVKAEEMIHNEKQGYIIMHTSSYVKKKIKIPQFTIVKVFLKIPFPYHAAGPLRPRAKELVDKRKSNNDNAIYNQVVFTKSLF